MRKIVLGVCLSIGSVNAADMNLNQDEEKDGPRARLEAVPVIPESAESAAAVPAPALSDPASAVRTPKINQSIYRHARVGRDGNPVLYCPGHKKKSWVSGTRWCPGGCRPVVD